MKQITLLLLTLVLSTASGQSVFRQDSVYIDRGTDQTGQLTPESRIYFVAYAENGRPSEIIMTQPLETGEWAFFQRRLLAYENGRLSTLRMQLWNQQKQEWLNFSERILAYNGDGEIENLTLRQAPGANQPLENLRKKTYTYTESGNQEEILQQRWRNGQWEHLWRQSNSYNEREELLTRQLQTWSGSEWDNKFRRTWTYDPATGNIQDIITEKWSAAAADWENILKRSFVYNNGGFWIGSLYERWNAGSQTWESNSRELHALNNRNTLDNFVFQIWQNGAWVNAAREVTFQSDLSFGNIVQRWDEQANQWENWTRYQTTLNEQALVGEVLEQQRWSKELAEWMNDARTQRSTYFWSDVTVDAQAPQLPKLDCLIPNPYRAGTTIRCDELPVNAEYKLDLYDLNGRQLSSQVFQSGAEIILPANLSRGTYLLQIRQDNRIRLAEKLLVVH